MKQVMILLHGVVLLLWMQPASAQWTILHSQDFEASVSPWTHTNGQGFPAGWDRQNSGLHPTSAPPNAGSWCLWIDSGAFGSGGAIDTAISPAIAVSGMLQTKLNWGIGYDDYYSGADYCQFLYRTFSENTWQPWIAGRTYTADVAKDDSIILGAVGDSIQIGVYYTDESTWAAWAALDNVQVTGWPISHDLAATTIDTPSTDTVAVGDFHPMATIHNAGNVPESNYWVSFTITDSNHVQVYADSLHVVAPDTILPDSSKSFVFPPFHPQTSMPYTASFATALSSDVNHANDSIVRQFYTESNGVTIVHPGFPGYSFAIRCNPNPFTTNIIINYQLPVAGMAKMTVYDITGQRIAILVNDFHDAGAHRISWKGTDATGHQLAAGKYLLCLSTSNRRTLRCVTLVR